MLVDWNAWSWSMRKTPAASGAIEDQAADLRREVSRAGVSERPVRLEAMNVGGAHAARDAIEFGVVPGDREGDGGVQQRAEVVGAMRELPEIVGVDQQVSADGLLEAGVELVAAARARMGAIAPKTFCASPPTPVALESSRFSLNGVSKVRA